MAIDESWLPSLVSISPNEVSTRSNFAHTSLIEESRFEREVSTWPNLVQISVIELSTAAIEESRSPSD